MISDQLTLNCDQLVGHRADVSRGPSGSALAFSEHISLENEGRTGRIGKIADILGARRG